MSDTAVMDPKDYTTMADSARSACELLRGLAHEARLMILCLLVDGEKSVSELEAFLEMRQPTVSQQLARLRADRLVTTRREGKTIYYALASDEARAVIAVLYDLYCKDAADCP
jgi:DNA-binding transcriptional ArsR family regulator